MGEFACLNGRMVARVNASVGITDRGLLLGDGLFETIRVKENEPLALSAHLTRLRAGADMLGFAVPGQELQNDIRALIAANQVRDGVVRVTVTRGEGQRGVAPPQNPFINVIITASPMVLAQTPMRLHVVTVTRRNEHSPLYRIKTLNYLDNILARMEAEEAGADDGILLNTAGRVAETSVGNLLFQYMGEWVTPPVIDGALPGTARASLIATGLVREQRLECVDLAEVTAAIMVNALSLRSVTHIGDRDILPPDAEFIASVQQVLDFS